VNAQSGVISATTEYAETNEVKFTVPAPDAAGERILLEGFKIISDNYHIDIVEEGNQGSSWYMIYNTVSGTASTIRMISSRVNVSPFSEFWTTWDNATSSMELGVTVKPGYVKKNLTITIRNTVTDLRNQVKPANYASTLAKHSVVPGDVDFPKPPPVPKEAPYKMIYHGRQAVTGRNHESTAVTGVFASPQVQFVTGCTYKLTFTGPFSLTQNVTRWWQMGVQSSTKYSNWTNLEYFVDRFLGNGNYTYDPQKVTFTGCFTATSTFHGKLYVTFIQQHSNSHWYQGSGDFNWTIERVNMP